MLDRLVILRLNDMGYLISLRSKNPSRTCFPVYLWNKLYFSVVYRSMNAMVLLQRKWRPGPIAFILRWTTEKWNSSHIYTLLLLLLLLFLHRFCSIFVKFWWKSCKISGEQKSYKPTCLVTMFNSPRHDMTSTERYVGQSPTDCIYPWRRLRVTSRERGSFIAVWTSSAQNRFI